MPRTGNIAPKTFSLYRFCPQGSADFQKKSRWLISFLLLFTLLFLQFPSAFGQDVSVQATVSKNEVFSGERIGFTIEISGDFSDVSRPQIPSSINGLRLLNNNPSTSRSYSFVNGKSQITYSYTYYFIAEKAGQFTIPPAVVSIDGRNYQTRSISIKVIDRNRAADNKDKKGRPDIFLALELSDENPVPGQQLLADVVLYFKENIRVLSYQPEPGWKAEGFWKEQLERTDRPRAVSTILNGVRYRKARLMQYALFPTKSGELTLSSYAVTVSVRTVERRQVDPFSSFFGGFGGQQRNVRVKTDQKTIAVQELPPLADAQYINAVGSFSISRKTNTKSTYVGETIEITTEVDGVGNVPLIGKPQYELPAGLEIYDPREQSEINRRGKKIAGKRSFTDVVIARNPGTYTIPDTTLAYYNTETNSYRKQDLSEITITVKPSPLAQRRTSSNGSSIEIQPIQGLTSWQVKNNAPVTDHWWFWGGLIFPAFLLGIGYWQKTYRDRLMSDRGFARSRYAQTTAENRLNEADELSSKTEIKEAYSKIHQAITGYISDKLNLKEAGLSDEEFVQILRDHNEIDDQTVKASKVLLEKCATIQYAPMAGRTDVEDDLQKAKNLLDKLQKGLAK